MGADLSDSTGFFQALRRLSRTCFGCQDRLHPDEHGAWNNVYKRFALRHEKGVW